MSTEARYVPTGKLQGDDKSISDHGASKSGEFKGSLGDAKKSDLEKGYCGKGAMAGADSDKGFA